MRQSVLIFIAAGMLLSWSATADAPVGLASQPPPVAITNGVGPALGLTEAQKANIRAEEIYRSQVRQELDAKADEDKSPLWTALNSSFVLWLLSSVVLSGLAACYTGWQNRHAKIKANQELIQKLDTEISNRIYEALSATVSYEGLIRNNKFSEPKEYYSLMLCYLNNGFISSGGKPNPDFSIFQEFKECGFRSLVTLLHDSLLFDPANGPIAAEFKDMLVIYEKYANLGSIPEIAPDMSKENLLRVILGIRETINTRILKDRWRKDDLY